MIYPKPYSIYLRRTITLDPGNIVSRLIRGRTRVTWVIGVITLLTTLQVDPGSIIGMSSISHSASPSYREREKTGSQFRLSGILSHVSQRLRPCMYPYVSQKASLQGDTETPKP